jgi:hypothetical protein
LYFPAGQIKQSSTICPGTLLYFPVGHWSQAASDNFACLKVPGAQAVTLEPEPLNPALAEQSVRSADAVGEYELIEGQDRHEATDVAAVAVEYLPALQLMHAV